MEDAVRLRFSGGLAGAGVVAGTGGVAVFAANARAFGDGADAMRVARASGRQLRAPHDQPFRWSDGAGSGGNLRQNATEMVAPSCTE
jgi:hypothetical protein